MARLSAIATLALAVIAAAVLYLTSHPGLDGTEVEAEFQDAYPLLEGMHVREYGAIAGSVAEIEVTDEGTALVTMQLNEGTDPPRADAIATIRQEDITGDSYVSLSPGDAPRPLGDEAIPVERTMVAPRFDDLLNSFDEPVRQGLELTLVELGKLLEARGEDVNAAALELRPALAAANDALTEVNEQNASLRSLVADAERVNRQAAARSRELGGLVDGLATTVATTAAHGPALDAAIDTLPETLDAADGTLGRVARFATAARPLAVSLRGTAPALASSARLLSPFLDDVEPILDDVEPTLDLTAKLLAAGAPTVEANPKRLFTAPFDIAAGVSNLLDALIGNPDLMRGFFSADTDGGREPGDFSDDLGFGSIGVEFGTQLGYPESYDPERRFVRASAVPNCESLGFPIRPGCLLDATAAIRRREGAASPGDRPGRPADPRSETAPPSRDEGGRGDLGEQLGGGLREALDDLGGGLREALGDLGGLGDGLGGLGGRDEARPSPAPSDLSTLLDFLLGR
jgi:phospholipid/cholesterol/gamma-HCH transport system substrate-binding protein